MALKLPSIITNGITVNIEGTDVAFTKPRWHPFAKQYLVDITWQGQGLYGMPLTSGVNILAAHGQCPIPNLWVLNGEKLSADLTEGSLSSMTLVIQ